MMPEISSLSYEDRLYECGVLSHGMKGLCSDLMVNQLDFLFYIQKISDFFFLKL